MDTHAPLIQHLTELRRRVMVSAVALLLAFAGCYLIADDIFAFLTDPLRQALGETAARRMIFTGLPEAFFVKVRLAFFAGFLAAFPVIAAQVYLFVAPGLYKKERLVLLPFLIAGPLLFFAGAALAYFYIFPLAWQFFISFETPGAGADALPVVLEARIGEYLSLVMQVILAFGLAFQLPILLTLLARVGIITPEWLAKKRKYAVVALITLAAILTPPDIISQIGLFLALYLLYEVSILASRWIAKR